MHIRSSGRIIKLFQNIKVPLTFSSKSVLKTGMMVVGGTGLAVGFGYVSLWSGKVHAAQLVSNINVKDFMALPITNLQTLEKEKDLMRTKMELMILKAQKTFISALEGEEPGGVTFVVDRWNRQDPTEGGSITCVLQDGETFEKAGVNVTVMRAPLSKHLQHSMRARGKELPEEEDFRFFVAGISSVIHPRNPHVPTVHFNYRYFEIQDKEGQTRHWWFGGGTDLTPYYLDEEDVKHFHTTYKAVCDKHSPKYYKKFKKWCDKYFYLSHRGESRGVGGIFFDDLESSNQEKIFQFVEDCASSVSNSYIPLVKKNKKKAVSEAQRRWQLIRRGRYVEFNLVYDRGTKFGFATPNARIESILMSLPLIARWEYMYAPDEGSPEEELLQVLKNPRDWV